MAMVAKEDKASIIEMVMVAISPATITTTKVEATMIEEATSTRIKRKKER